MEKLGFNLGMAVASRRKAVPISILMREFEGLGHADGAATICPDPGNGPALSRTQESFARGRQIDPALGILAYLPIEIRYIIWEFLLMPQPGDWNEDRRKYGSINSPKNLLHSYHNWYRRKTRPWVHQCDAVVTLRHISPKIRLEVEKVLFPKTIFQFDSALDCISWLGKLDSRQTSLLRHLHFSMWNCDRIWHFGRWRRFCVRADCKVEDMFTLDTCKTCQWLAIFSAGILPPTLETITFKFEHDHGQEVYQFDFGLGGVHESFQKRAVDELSIVRSPKSIQRASAGSVGCWYDMMLLEIFSRLAMRALPRVRVKVDESYLRCGECREESEMIMAEIEHDSFAVSSSPSDGARDN